MQEIRHAHLRRVGADPQGRRAFPATFGAFGLGEPAAGAGVGPEAIRMRGARRLGDLAPGAIALIDPVAQGRDRCGVRIEALGLADQRGIEVQAQCGQISQLPCLGLPGRADAIGVQILDAQQQVTIRAARKEPREYGRPQIADVEV